MTTARNPYYQPSAFGLELMAELDIACDSSEFDMVCVWRHRMTGIWYAAADMGCCCPTPFDGVTGEDLTAVFTIDRIADFARNAWSDETEAKREQAVEALTSLVRESWRKAGVR